MLARLHVAIARIRGLFASRTLDAEFEHEMATHLDMLADDYAARRRSQEEPLYPHSLVLRVPAQTGVVGSLLFGGFVVAAGIAVARARGRPGAPAAGTAAAAAAAYFAIHGSIDWFWEFAGLGAPGAYAAPASHAHRAPRAAGAGHA